MSHFARINRRNQVIQVIVADSVEWCEQALGGTWIETFKDGSQRFNYAGIGFIYDEERDAFIPPKPFESWILDEDSCLWQSPIPYPGDGGAYYWDEVAGDWVEVTEPNA